MKKISLYPFFLLLVCSDFLECTQETINKIYIFYTPSHKILRDNWFLPSLKDDYEVIEEFYPQEGLGTYMSSGWMTMMHHKVDLIIRGIKENWGGIFIHSDVDVQFFKPTKELLVTAIKDNDIVIQKNTIKGKCCCGFFACRGNEKALKLWQEVKQYMSDNPGKNDQDALNALLHDTNPFAIDWQYLSEKFISGGVLRDNGWKIPENLVLHHANCIEGIKNKIAQLERIKKTVENGLI